MVGEENWLPIVYYDLSATNPRLFHLHPCMFHPFSVFFYTWVFYLKSSTFLTQHKSDHVVIKIMQAPCSSLKSWKFHCLFTGIFSIYFLSYPSICFCERHSYGFTCLHNPIRTILGDNNHIETSNICITSYWGHHNCMLGTEIKLMILFFHSHFYFNAKSFLRTEPKL